MRFSKIYRKITVNTDNITHKKRIKIDKKMSQDEETAVLSPDCQIRINKWKVREGFQVNNNQLILLYELTSGNDTEIKRLKSTKCGVVKKRFFKDGDVVDAK